MLVKRFEIVPQNDTIENILMRKKYHSKMMLPEGYNLAIVLNSKGKYLNDKSECSKQANKTLMSSFE